MTGLSLADVIAEGKTENEKSFARVDKWGDSLADLPRRPTEVTR